MMYRRQLDTEGYPREQLPDMFTRRDELLIQLDKTLKQLVALLGGGIPGGGGGDGDTTITIPVTRAKRLQITYLSLETADKEYSFQFPEGTKSFLLHTRNGNAVRIADTSGLVASSSNPYFTMKANTAPSSDDLDLDPNIKWYFACSVASEVLEIIVGV